MSSNTHNEAGQALERLRAHLSEESAQHIEQRLISWQRATAARQRPATSLPELVMRPGLPPRPLNKHYFTVIRSL